MSDNVPVNTQDTMTAEQQGAFFDPVGAANRAGSVTPPRPLLTALAYPTPQAVSPGEDINKFGAMSTSELRDFTPPSDEACQGAHAHDVVMGEATNDDGGQAADSANIMLQIAAAAQGPASHGHAAQSPVAQDAVIQVPAAQGPAIAAANVQGSHIDETPEVDTSYSSLDPSLGPGSSFASIEASLGPDASFNGVVQGTPERDAAFNAAMEDTPGPEGTPGSDTPMQDIVEASTNPDGSLRPGHFRCRFDDHNPCRTGQTSMHLARKTISDHFGRNKAQTRAIKSWPLFCRKHYQRATYKTDQWQLRKCVLILEQLETIERQFPGARYTIILKKSEATRLNGFLMAMANGTPVDQARAQFAPNETNRKSFEAPLHVLGELGRYLGKDKPRTDVEIVVALVRGMLRDKECKQFPAVEFLPQLPLARDAPAVTQATQATEQA